MQEKTIAIIPARGSSKRIPRKNIKPFFGKPMIAYSIEAAINAKLFDEIIVSTDDDEIADIAQKFGASVPFMRPKELSDAIKAEAQQQDAKFVASFDNNRAYVNEFQHVDFYSFTIVPKKQKINKYHIYVTYMSPKKLSKEDINKVIDATLNKAEGLIK